MHSKLRFATAEIIFKRYEFIKKEIDVGFTPNKLKSGSGQQCIFVLLHLSRLALEQDGFAFGE
jgi:hypothetical protein